MDGDNLRRLTGAYEALVARRFELIDEYFHPDAVYRSSRTFPGIKPVYRGHAEIRELLRTSTEPWEHLALEPVRSVVEGELVVAEVRLTGRGAGSGIDVAQNVGHVIRFRDSMIVEFTAHATFDDALEAAGLEACPA